MRTFLSAVTLGLAACVVAAPALGAPATSKKRPCYKHTTKTVPTKKTCLAAYKRSRMAWPPNPTEAEIKKRVGAYNWNKAARVANCETGGTRGAHPTRGNVRWYITEDGTPTGSYISALGMFARTFAYGAKATGYRGRTYQEQVAIAVASFPITRGWSGWSCGGA